MKRTKKTSSLLTVTAAVAGVAMGASIAMAAHPPIQLYTYEEVAQQMGFPKAPVMVDRVTKQGMPYSPKQTCFGDQGTTACHGNAAAGNSKLAKSYDDLSKHAYHAALGFNEWMDNSKGGLFVSTGDADLLPKGTQTGLAANKPWVQSHGHNGKW
ncbi:cytochrome C [Geomonas subterranea]|uniref:Cytochrome C n=1 Tax=Geomonas subterranea TaxID=2847989 RepID=A0ABX8LI24_9BACT|nr:MULTISPECIES: cytochrome C [Geomonas]QXE90971.1 cytochrome C [Geomonas subterranea]QXM10943.1 cytochrome C [Geomonas subterranea]